MEIWLLKLADSAPVLLAFVIGFVYIGLRLKEVQDDISDLKTGMTACKADRAKEEAELHGRVTANAQRVAYLEGLKNGGGHA